MKDIYNESYNFWELFSRSIEIFFANFKNILFICLLVYVPINTASYFLSDFLLSSPDASFKDFSNYLKMIWRLENIIWTLASIFVIFTVKDYLDWKTLSFWEILKQAFSKWWIVIWANIMYSIWVWLLLLLLVIPWIMFWIYWVFFIYLIVLKWVSATKSFEYSKKIVKWRWWEIFWYCLLSFLSAFLIWVWFWFTNIPDNIYTSVSTDLIIDLVSLFVVVLFTLKFINIDKEQYIEKKEEIIEIKDVTNEPIKQM